MRVKVERKCIYCGEIFLSKSSQALFCCKAHKDHYYRGIQKAVCPHNDGVVCTSQKCDYCGWNPEVAKKRLEAFMEVHHD